MAISAANIALPPPLSPPYSISKFFPSVERGKKRKKGKENRTIKFTSRRRGIGGIGVDLSAVFLFLSCIAMEILPVTEEGNEGGERRRGEGKGKEIFFYLWLREFYILGLVIYII